MCTFDEIQRQRDALMTLPSAVLVEALLDFSYRHRDVAAWVARVSSNEAENLEAFHEGLRAFREDKAYIVQSETPQYARELADLLETLEAAVTEPREGLECLAEFYRSDGDLIDRSDDSWGAVGDVFQNEAVEVFVRYAHNCADKDWVMDLLLALLESDDYGVRDRLASSAPQFFSEENLKVLALRYRQNAESAQSDFSRSRWLRISGELEKGLEDPKRDP